MVIRINPPLNDPYDENQAKDIYICSFIQNQGSYQFIFRIILMQNVHNYMRERDMGL
jgi:hypothetical protein